ncbi:MAG: exodeoxyribonuclease VII small subunit [Oligoflexia bacterium]|nr:exodeoxyribonuclease VII small subunit [Oligoflexia bacterium]
MTQENPSFEAALEQLQAIVKRLESGELSLEQSLQHFEEGVRLTRSCQERLSVAEQRVEILLKEGAGGQAETAPFRGPAQG